MRLIRRKLKFSDFDQTAPSTPPAFGAGAGEPSQNGKPPQHRHPTRQGLSSALFHQLWVLRRGRRRRERQRGGDAPQPQIRPCQVVIDAGDSNEEGRIRVAYRSQQRNGKPESKSSAVGRDREAAGSEESLSIDDLRAARDGIPGRNGGVR